MSSSRTLARKAASDATAVREFAGNSDIADEIIGFHAQQAIEKWLKAIIAGRGESFEHTHDLRRLVRVAAHDLDKAPFDVDAVITLTQYSAPLRYEDLLDAESLDQRDRPYAGCRSFTRHRAIAIPVQKPLENKQFWEDCPRTIARFPRLMPRSPVL